MTREEILNALRRAVNEIPKLWNLDCLNDEYPRWLESVKKITTKLTEKESTELEDVIKAASVIYPYIGPRWLDNGYDFWRAQYRNRLQFVEQRLKDILYEQQIGVTAGVSLSSDESQKDRTSTVKKCDLALIVPLREEFQVLEKLCCRIKSKFHQGLVYYSLNIANCDYEVLAVVMGDEGNTLARGITEKVLGHVKPQVVVVLGIAGAIDEALKLGDVVIAKEVSEFLAQSKAVQKGKSFVLKYSGNHWDTDFILKNYVANFEFSERESYNAWQNDVRKFREGLQLRPKHKALVRDVPKVEDGPIASGPTTGASEAYAVELRGINRKFLALEKEAAGVVSAAKERAEQPKTMVIRGISDFADERKKELDLVGDGMLRTYAVYSAATFLLSLLRARTFQQIIAPSSVASPISSNQMFDVRPIQSQGENIFLVDKKGEPGGLDEFFVKVHFNLWTKYPIEIVNINLSYNLPEARPGRQKISIDGPQDQDVYERLDASYRMMERRRVEERSVSNIFVSRRFVCNHGMADYADHGIVTIDCEATSPAWEGIKVLTIKGRLSADGKFDVLEVTVHGHT